MLKKEQKQFCFIKIIASNKILKKWLNKYSPRNKRRKFRAELLSGVENPLNCIPKTEIKLFRKEIAVVLDCHNTRYENLDGMTIEEFLLQEHQKLCNKIAYKWSNRNKNYSHDDLYSESILAMLDSIYNYSDEKTAFLTYSWHVLTNHLYRYVNRNSLFGPPSDKEIELHIKFDKLNQVLNNPDEVYQRLNFSSEDIFILERYLKTKKLLREHSYRINDKKISLFDEKPKSCKLSIDSMNKIHLDDIYKLANLSRLEKLVVNYSLNYGVGWKTKLSEKLKKHGKYSKMKIAKIYDESLQKLKTAIIADREKIST